MQIGFIIIMNLIPTELNQRLASAIRYSVAADRFYITGKAGFWRLVGLGIIGFGIGASVGVVLYGYSFVSRNSENLNILSATFSKSLSEVRLRATAEGTVHLEPSEVALVQGQTISLDSNSRLLLDPSAKVRVEGEIQVPAISVPQVVPSRSNSPIPTIVNFTVFKSVPFGKGVIQTGWIFLTSTQMSPTHQYCYYTEATDTPGRNVMLDIGVNERLEAPKIMPQNFD